jgi:hypothetical protein
MIDCTSKHLCEDEMATPGPVEVLVAAFLLAAAFFLGATFAGLGL